MASSPFDKAYELLLAHYGPQSEMPGGSPLERLVAAVSAPRGGPARAAEALENLREADALDPQTLSELDLDELADLLKPSGAARQAAARLRKIARFFVDRYEGDADAMLAADTESLRTELTAINGIGRPTADAILLYAARRPVFVVDRSAHRVFKRHGWSDFEADDDEVQAMVEAASGHDAWRLAQFHALVDRVGRDYCGSRPLCDDCPLADLLPDGGPREPEVA